MQQKARLHPGTLARRAEQLFEAQRELRAGHTRPESLPPRTLPRRHLVCDSRARRTLLPSLLHRAHSPGAPHTSTAVEHRRRIDGQSALGRLPACEQYMYARCANHKEHLAQLRGRARLFGRGSPSGGGLLGR